MVHSWICVFTSILYAQLRVKKLCVLKQKSWGCLFVNLAHIVKNLNEQCSETWVAFIFLFWLFALNSCGDLKQLYIILYPLNIHSSTILMVSVNVCGSFNGKKIISIAEPAFHVQPGRNKGGLAPFAT